MPGMEIPQTRIQPLHDQGPATLAAYTQRGFGPVSVPEATQSHDRVTEWTPTITSLR